MPLPELRNEQKLKAGALIYALFIMVISVIKVGVVMGTAYFYHNRQIDYINQQKMLSFTQSALLTALNDSTITFPWQIDLPETVSSKTFTGSIERYGYGAFQRFIIQLVLGKYHHKEAVLAGTSGILPAQTAVFIPADSYELCLSGILWNRMVNLNINVVLINNLFQIAPEYE